MTPEQDAALRAPFPAAAIGKLPRVWCAACRESRDRHCAKHERRKCADCANMITAAHRHLDYVGHAEVTDRLRTVDPGWTWQPLATGPDGLPALDRHGGLWITLTVAGVSRLGYGAADGKTGTDAVKETIGDAIRNAAMRFGVALDLWGATAGDDEPVRESPGELTWKDARRAAARAGADGAMFYGDLADRFGQRAPVNATDPKGFVDLTAAELRTVYGHWRQRADERAAGAEQVALQDAAADAAGTGG